jgi:broad specificity phosphatase PhoE
VTRLAVIRHGATAWTEARRLQGRHDTCLSVAGAAAVRAWCLPVALSGFDWFSSPLRRCRETAALLRGQPMGPPGEADDPAVRLEPRLIEMSFGAWEGRTLAELRATLGAAMAREEARGLDFRPPEGESPREVQARLHPWLAERGAAGRDSIAVTHRGVIRALYALATGWPMVGKPPVRLIDPALHLFTLSAAGDPTVQALNLPVCAP